MALSATILWEVRSTATAGNTGGGGFKPGATGTDFSLQDAAQFALTTATSAGIGAVVLHASAATTMVGNIAHVISGTNFTVGWYEIISVVAGVSFTVDRNVTSGVGANGVINIGGAMSMGSTLDQDFLAIVAGGNTIWMKNGSYTLGEAVAVSSGLSVLGTPVKFKGYNSTRGDDPRGSTRPTVDTNGNTFNLDQYWQVSNLIITGNTANICAGGLGMEYNYCKITNTSSTTARNCINNGADTSVFGCELVAQNGTGIVTALGLKIVGSYFHDSNNGVLTGAATGRCNVSGNVFESMITAGVNVALTSTGFAVQNNTFYGAEAKSSGSGLIIGSGSPSVRFTNNIFYGWTTGVNIGGANGSCSGAYNDFFNNTTNGTNYTLDGTDITVNPGFAGASQITGSTATTSASTLTQAGGDFSTVTDNVDYVRVISGTGVTTGVYLITGHSGTTLTTNNALGTSSGGDVVYVVGVGHNFAPGTALRATGWPGTFGAETTSYMDIGAVQRQESAGVGASYVF